MELPLDVVGVQPAVVLLLCLKYTLLDFELDVTLSLSLCG
jgi:hypothetical protein